MSATILTSKSSGPEGIADNILISKKAIYSKMPNLCSSKSSSDVNRFLDQRFPQNCRWEKVALIVGSVGFSSILIIASCAFGAHLLAHGSMWGGGALFIGGGILSVGTIAGLIACITVSKTISVEELQYQKFSELTALLDQVQDNPSDDHLNAFEKLLPELMSVVEEDVAITHMRRLHTNYKYIDVFIDIYKNKKEFEKELVRFHEIIEALSFKWDHGFDFTEKASPYNTSYFNNAHEKAVQAENLLMILQSRKLNIPLTYKALKYLRLVDEKLRYPLDHVYSLEYLDKRKIERLTKNQQNIPSSEEMQDFIDFVLKTKCFEKEVGKKGIYKIVYSRYFFSKLYKLCDSDKKKSFLILAICLLIKDETYQKFTVENLLSSLKKVLEIPSSEFRIGSFYFSYNKELLERGNLGVVSSIDRIIRKNL